MLRERAVTVWKGVTVHPMVQVFGASMLIAMSAQLAFPIPFSPVPVTGQSLAILLVGGMLAPRMALGAVLLYLLEGGAGLPVFAGFGAGIHHLAGPTGGYLWAFLPAVWLMSVLSESKGRRSTLRYLLAGTAGTLVIFAGGLGWLRLFVDGGVLAAGLYPFIPGAVLKTGVAAMVLGRLKN